MDVPLSRSDGRSDPSSSKGASTGLYRAPTWARNINFDTSFDLNTHPSPEINGYSSPSDGFTGLALSGSPQLSDHQEVLPPSPYIQQERNVLQHSRNGSTGVSSQSRRSPHIRQLSNTPNTPLKNSPTLTQSDRSTPKATSKAVMSSMLPSHQRVASASSASGSVDWSRPPMLSQLHSSADLYAITDSRADTSTNTVEAVVDDNKEEGRDHALLNGVGKRASVLSFQTALSGVGEFDEAGRGSQYGSAQGSEFGVLDKALPQRPWLTADATPSGTSSFNSSADERHLPGGWGGSGKQQQQQQQQQWERGADDVMPARAQGFRNGSPATGRSPSGEAARSPSLSPNQRIVPLDEEGSRQHSFYSQNSSPAEAPSSPTFNRSPVLSLQELKPARRPSSMLRNDTTEELLSSGPLSPISGASSTIDAPLVTSNITVGPDLSSRRTSLDANAGQQNKANMQVQSKQYADQPFNGRFVEAKKMLQEDEPPTVPEKSSPPIVPSKSEVGLSSPPLSDNVVSPSLPSEIAEDKANIPAQMPADRSPVLDFRRKPLAVMTEDNEPEKPQVQAHRRSNGSNNDLGGPAAAIGAAGIVAATAAAVSSSSSSTKVGAGIGAHASRNSGGEQNAAPAFAALMRSPSTGVPTRASLATVPPSVPIDRSPSPSIDTPPREPSPPPEGEVEARAEWERSQMRQMAERAKRASGTPRKTTFRGQLKPLQLVSAEETKRTTGKSSPVRETPRSRSITPLESPIDEMRTGLGDPYSVTAAAPATRQLSDGSAGLNSASMAMTSVPTNGKSGGGGGGGLSTQQLQRQLARDQRRSVSAVNMTMGQMGVSDIGGAYPVFPSPSASPINVLGTNRQYAGLMPQRSLVPPFELQNRPDGLPSALMGPDGVRRSPNDPEVCLECMMRDEDMIDVHVLGAGLWERESDLDFTEAIRLEAQEDAKQEKAKSLEASALTGNTFEKELDSSNIGGEGEASNTKREVPPASTSKTRFTKIRVNKVAKGEPLTAERLKLHTQMNPPASSHRWRTLQTFLAIQAKYIAIEQKARGIAPPALPPKSGPGYDNAMIKTPSGDRLVQRQRVASPGLFQVEEVPLTPEEKAQKEKDIVNAREARRRNNTSGQSGANLGADGLAVLEDVAKNRLSGPPVVNDNSSGHHSIPRRTNVGPSTFGRAGSIQDLRMIPNAMAGKIDLPSSPNTLAPPAASFRGPSSPTTPRTFGARMRSVSSQMSLANSGSMVDMHVGLEDRKEHRISQAGFVPGTPLHSQSPGALNRAFYGFPTEDEMEHVDEWGNSRAYDQSMGNSFGDYEDSYSAARGSPELERKKKKGSGFKGFFSKISGKEAGDQSRSSRQQEDDSIDSPDRRYSMGPDSPMELQPPPGMGGLLSRARRSTSSLLMPSGRQSMDSTMMLGDRGFNNPLMASQTSLELGPFVNGPLPPPRKDSRLSQMPVTPSTPAKEKSSRLRAFSSGNLMSKKKNAIVPSPSSRSSSMMQNMAIPNSAGPAPTTSDRDPGDRLSMMSRLSGRNEQFQPGSRIASQTQAREGNYPSSPGLSTAAQYGEGSYQQQNVSTPRTPISQYPIHPMQTERSRSPLMQRFNKSEGFLPGSNGEDQNGQDMSTDDANAPRRPPRNPHREAVSGPSSSEQRSSMDILSQSRSQPLQIPTSLQKEQYYHSFDSQLQNGPDGMQILIEQQTDQDMYPSQGFVNPPTPTQSSTNTPSRRSKLLKLPFTKNKRESLASTEAIPKEPLGLRSRSSRATLDDNAEFGFNNSNLSNTTPFPSGFDSMRSTTRPRDTSNSSYEDRGLPPRSQSAMSMLDASNLSTNSPGNFRSFFPRLRTNSRAALREVQED